MIRAIPLSDADASRLRKIGLRLSATHAEDAALCMAIATAWEFAPQAFADSFNCNVDESAGLAELYEFPGHSVRV